MMSNVTWSDPKVILDDLKNRSNECHICRSTTNHKSLVKVLFSITNEAEDEYSNSETGWKEFEIIQCQGCMEPRLKVEEYNSEDMNCHALEPIIAFSYYPAMNEQIPFEHLHRLPEALSDMYTETLSAINNGCLTIAGIGIRGLIETICREEEISGRDLFAKINNLFTAGKISNDNKEILHSIRQLYNRSVHESFKPTIKQLRVSLDIIELLMKQIYVHSHDIKKLITKP